jgi:hypothetical protein
MQYGGRRGPGYARTWIANAARHRTVSYADGWGRDIAQPIRCHIPEDARKSGGAQPIPRRFSRSRLKTWPHRISYVAYWLPARGRCRAIAGRRGGWAAGLAVSSPRRCGAVHSVRGTTSDGTGPETRGSPRAPGGPPGARHECRGNGGGWLGAPVVSAHARVFTPHPQGWSRPRRACLDGASAHSGAVEESLFNQLLHQALHHHAVEAESDGSGDLIGGDAAWFLPRDDGEDLIGLRLIGARSSGDPRRVGIVEFVEIVGQGTACLSSTGLSVSAHAPWWCVEHPRTHRRRCYAAR